MLSIPESVYNLIRAGIDSQDAFALRRIAMTLHRWYELECGTDAGHIERDEKTDVPRYYNARARYIDPHDPRASCAIPDRESGAKKRLAKIMSKYPDFAAYLQTDPRGAPLYVLTPYHLRESPYAGQPIDQIYNHGIAVYK